MDINFYPTTFIEEFEVSSEGGIWQDLEKCGKN
jgi:hypothetical protein